jgi:UDP-2-acetamido-2,6-beta-L-arabino-hexul-4-ose reductase
MRINIRKIEKHEDSRGWLIEVLRADTTNEDIKHIHFSTSKPNAVRGKHYHKRKFEWFCVVKGVAKLILEDINTKERQELILSEENPLSVEIHPYVVHTIQNIGSSDMYLLSIVNEVFDLKDADTYGV